MSKASEAANAVMAAVEQVCGMYGVQCTREQSRAINMADDRRQSGYRVMYFGKWADDFGTVHTAGRADILARPRVEILYGAVVVAYVSIPLWIECKSGSGKLKHDQKAFRQWVTNNGDAYLALHDDVRPLINWFISHGVKKEPKTVIKAEPLNTAAVDSLPCKWCHEPKEKHLNKIRACARPEALGKVWTPKLTK